MVKTRLPAWIVVPLIAAAFPLSAAEAAPTCLGRRATIEGTAGDDQLTGTDKADVIVGSRGDDVIQGFAGNDLICGGDGVDAIFGDGGRDRVSGDDGDDQVAGGDGNDEISGGKGADYVNYFVAPGPVRVDLAQGSASGDGIDEIDSIENIFGSVFGDELIGDAAPNSIAPLDGDDQVAAGGGIDLIFDGVGPGSEGTDGNDSFSGGASYDGVLYSSSPNAVQVDLADGRATGNGTDDLMELEGVFGSDFSDTLSGDEGRNLLLGRGGNDVLDGRGGGDAVAYWFAEGQVTADLSSSSGSARAEGTDQFANVEGLLGSVFFGDSLTGDDADNLIDGDGANDTLNGAGGNDWLVGGTGDDVIDGGPGDYDLVDHSNTAFLEVVAAVRVDLAAGTSTGQGTDTITSVEAAMGSSLEDRLEGDAATNYLFGNAGDDKIAGLAGGDFLDGGAGPDEATGGPGADNCVAADRKTSCEGRQSAPTHPVLKEAAVIERLRRSFRRSF